ncbi:MAG: FecR domain-containing protein [Opitutae bacterium]|nr:FecR domain-containing protein [Opitutae bacterium]
MMIRLHRLSFARVLPAILCTLLSAAEFPNQSPQMNPRNGLARLDPPVPKFHLTSAYGEAEVTQGERTRRLEFRDTAAARDATFRTKAGTEISLAFSNGAIIALADESNIHIDDFTQDTSARQESDVEAELAASRLQIRLKHGRVAFAASAGQSSLVSEFGTVRMHGGRVTMEVGLQGMNVSIFSGEALVTVGLNGMGAVVRAGEQAKLLPGEPMTIGPIPSEGKNRDAKLMALVEQAANAVVFEQTGRGGDWEFVPHPLTSANPPSSLVISPDRLQ